MKIQNIRLGHASNSSSSHSIVILPRGQTPPPDDLVDGWVADQGFGWSNFTLSSADAKMRYFGQMLARQLDLPSWIKTQAIEEITGVGYNPNGHIDHESVWTLPVDADGMPHEGFVRDLVAYLKQENVVILGGNDNSDDHPLAQPEHLEAHGWKQHDFTLESPYSARWRARKDGDWWILFNYVNGNKLTFSFLDNPKPRERANAPELLDIKINSYCPFGCAFCSQASTKEGDHASFDDIWTLAAQLKSMEVFEVALGGGEPTLHPELDRLLRTFKGKGINVSITTRSLTWIRNLSVERGRQLSAIGFSCHTPSEVVKVANALPDLPDLPMVRLHVVVGSMPLEDICDILRQAASYRLEVLLLGFKPVGFGADYKPQPADGLYEFVQKQRRNLGRIAIDTQLAACWSDALAEDDLKLLYYTSEGSYSAYYDMMTNRLRPSSYAPLEYQVPVTKHNIEEAWRDLAVYTPEPFLPSV